MENPDLERLRERLREETPFWAEKFAKIVTKQGQLVPLVAKRGQLELDATLEGQRSEGRPMRAIVLKARQIGFSTWTQAKLVHRCTLRERYDAVTIAHDKETGGKLFRMFETIWGNLPDDPELRPEAHTYRRSQYLHLGGDILRHAGEVFPDSRYTVDTAGEFQAGRGGTYRAIHASEVAFWPRINEKLTALMSAVPDDPETLFVMESTANGFNEFKDRWDDAEAGRSGWAAFFWPWFNEPDYRLEFASEGEKERFVIGDPTSPYAEEEPDLVERFELEPEQLHWRRQVIAAKFGGDIRFFDQEYPATPHHAFIATGRKVFDPYKVTRLMDRVERTDPRRPSEECPGPRIGDLRGGETRTFPTQRGGVLEVPTSALWTPRPRGVSNRKPPWRFWLESDGRGGVKVESQYVIGVDVSGGNTESTDEPDYHAIQVVDHKTLEQVAEFRAQRLDVDLLTREVLLAALFFRKALVAVERTGGWGSPVARILYHDFHYPHVYRSKRVGNTTERIDQRLGWDTNVRTKPELIAHATELLRDEVDGIRSRLLVSEMQTYTRTEKGTAEAEPKKYDDLLMAWMIAQQVAKESFLRESSPTASRAPSLATSAGLGAYDARMR